MRLLRRFERLEDRRLLASTSAVEVYRVDDDGLDFPAADFSSIQAAVDEADENDKIIVAPGFYEEAIVINNEKDGLKLMSQRPREAVVKAPEGEDLATVHVQAENVELKGFTIHGTAGIIAAVYVGDADGASARVHHNHIAVRDATPLTGDQTGVAVLVGDSIRIAGTNFGSATVDHNLIDEFQKGGVVVNGGGSSAEVAHNQVVGTLATYLDGQAAQNGIQVSGGADGNVHHNQVSDVSYEPNPEGIQYAASSILIAGAGDVSVAHNHISGGDGAADNNVGIYVLSSTDVEVSQNRVDGNDYGILLVYADDVVVSHNQISGGTLGDFNFGVYVFFSDNVEVSGNRVNATNYGILLDNVANALVSKNKLSDNEVYDIALFAVMDSDLLGNQSNKDDGVDFYDDAAEGENNWVKNKGQLEYA